MRRDGFWCTVVCNHTLFPDDPSRSETNLVSQLCYKICTICLVCNLQNPLSDKALTDLTTSTHSSHLVAVLGGQ